MKTLLRALAAVGIATAIAGCAYKPLKAPCSADEGGVVGTYSSLKAIQPNSAHDPCGLMRPI